MCESFDRLRQEFVNREASRRSAELIGRMYREAWPLIVKHTISIVQEVNNSVRQLATGVLVQARDRKLILTAGHVIDEIRTDKGNVSIPTGHQKASGKIINRWEMQTNTIIGRRGQDMIDVGLIEIPADILAEMSDSFEFLELDHIDSEDPKEIGSQYLLVGFPAGSNWRRWGQRNFSVKPFGYGTKIYRDERGTVANLLSLNVVVDYSKRKNRDLSNNIVNSPSAKGLSGSGIWRVYSPQIDSTKWDPNQTRLVGIAHTWHGKPLEVIRGTIPIVHLDLIKN